MRILERFNGRQLLSRINGAYRRFFNDEQDAKLILRDIVSFSGLCEYRDSPTVSRDDLLVMEGRKQMAMHMLRHIDIEPREFVEAHNDAIAQFATDEDID